MIASVIVVNVLCVVLVVVIDGAVLLGCKCRSSSSLSVGRSSAIKVVVGVALSGSSGASSSMY